MKKSMMTTVILLAIFGAIGLLAYPFFVKFQDKIEAKWPKSTGRMDDEAKFFDSVIGSLAAMQNPYRNSTMHFDAKYTQDEAEHISLLVKGIMSKIASRMDEDGLPLA